MSGAVQIWFIARTGYVQWGGNEWRTPATYCLDRGPRPYFSRFEVEGEFAVENDKLL